MVVPDGSILARGLTSMTSKFLAESQDATFRTQLVRSTYRVDGQPKLEDVIRYQQHLQAEIESSVAARTSLTTTTPALKAVTPDAGNPGVKDTKPCKFFLKASGCRRGARCPFGHNLDGLSKAEKAKKCLACGSEEHRLRECPTKAGKPAPTSPTTRNSDRGGQSPATSPVANVNKAHAEPEGESSPSRGGGEAPVQGQPVLSWETLLQAAAKVAGTAPPEAKAPMLKVISVSATTGPGLQDSQAYALVDSGATHPLRKAGSEDEWHLGTDVVVNLAGGESVRLKMNQAGTLLLPPADCDQGSKGATPIVPLGSLVETLGYRLEWCGSKCRLFGKEGEVINLRVRNGCPEITEHQALSLIAKIEDHKLESLKSLTEITKSRVRQAALMLEKTWFDHLLNYCDSGISSTALQALQAAPFFDGVPRPALQGLVEAVPCENGWEALKGLRHLNRRTRKRLWSSSQWVLHLFSGKRENKEIMFLERQGYTVLEIDIEKGKSHDVCDPLVWRALEWGARHGKIASIVGGPPQNTFMLRRHMSPGPEALRNPDFLYGGWEGQSAAEVDMVNKHTGFFVKMIFLHALATAGRCKFPAEAGDVREVGFMLEQPRDPRGYLRFGHPLYQDSVSFWRTPMWEAYAEEAALSSYSFDMSSLGKALSRQTTIGTNLPLRFLDGLRGRIQHDALPPERAPPSVWSKEFSEVVAIAIRAQRQTPKMLKMSTEQWREHVRRGHLPYRADCLTCVSAGATGRRHARVEHPSCFVMSADVSGPLKTPGLDADARGAFPKPHKYLFVAKVRVPKTFLDDGRGAFVEYDPGEVDEEEPIKEGAFDYDSGDGEAPGAEGEESRPPDASEGEDCKDEEEIKSKKDPNRYDDDTDLQGPDLVNLIFAVAIPDNKGATVLEAIQDVVLYCSSLNIPILRFHCDRGMEFYARSTRQWLKYHGIRFTTSEGGLHQQNGVVENAVRYVKQRARTLLFGAKLPQRLWPQAVSLAAASQRATVLGMETRLVAPFGAHVLVRKREYGGSAEPGKPDDLAPRWVEGYYLGLSDTVRRGHVIYVVDGETEKFIHTVHVRTELVDPKPAEDLEADLPGPPSRRLRGKSAGSGDVVAVSKAQAVESDVDLKEKVEATMTAWSQEEAESLLVQVALMLDPNERIFGAFRHGGSVGITKVTTEKKWVTEFLVKAFLELCPDAEFTSLYVSVNSPRNLHMDSNNLTGKNNYLYPVVMPRRGGDLWVEIRDGDVVKGKISEMVDQRGVPHYGCVMPLKQGQVTVFDPHRRHAVLPWKGLRIVLVGYTTGVLQNLPAEDRKLLVDLHFPLPPEADEPLLSAAIRMMRMNGIAPDTVEEKFIVENIDGIEGEEVITSDGEMFVLRESMSASSSSEPRQEIARAVCEGEDMDHWELYLPLADGDPQTVPKAMIGASATRPQIEKVEVTYTPEIEQLLSSLTVPLAVVHTVDPREAQENFPKWLVPVKKELTSFDHAVKKRSSRDEDVVCDLREGRARLVPMKIVYTAKPPTDEAVLQGELYRRKARIVACGNMMAASGEDTYAAAAPAEVVRSSLAISSRRGWEAGIIDITSAFLQTPLDQVNCRYRVFGQPPRVLVRAGLCAEDELWEFTHAVYGLRESPRWWGEYRDLSLAHLTVTIEGRRITLARCRVESSWWKVVEESAVIGVLVIYVDDTLICSTQAVVKAIAKAIRGLWSTSPLALASDGAIKFLGLEIERIEGGFAVGQADYIRELLRIHEVKETQRDLIPVAREQASFVAVEDEMIFSEEELRRAQQCAGEILWVSQRSRPDLAYTASLVSSLTTKAPRRACSITRKCLGFLQRTTIDYRLHVVARGSELVSWTDASFAPEGGRSHTGWLITAGDSPLAWRSSRQASVTLSTAEAELLASTEGALALCSLSALIQEILEEPWSLTLKTDSTSSMAIQHGSGSWRTRHLRIKAAWIAEKVEKREITIEHCAGAVQLADALTKPLASVRLTQLSKMMGLFTAPEPRASDPASTENLSSKPSISRVLVALLVLSQAVLPVKSMELVPHQPLAVDHSLVAWCVFGVIALLWTLAWELLKYVGWQLYFTAAPGAGDRRMRRLQRIPRHYGSSDTE